MPLHLPSNPMEERGSHPAWRQGTGHGIRAGDRGDERRIGQLMSESTHRDLGTKPEGDLHLQSKGDVFKFEV